MDVRGLRARYHRPGIGAPLAASALPIDGEASADALLAPDVKVSVTAVLRFDEVRPQLASGKLRASLELYITTRGASAAVTTGDRPVPLEVGSTAILAYRLAESPIWEQELSHFFLNLGVRDAKSARLTSGAPYQPGRIPVFFVHGTALRLGRWAEMVNRLGNDPRTARRYQFWFFTYDTGSPIGYFATL